MFGMGFMEIFLVLIVAIIALGPEKLPTAIVDMAKFFKKIKGEINEAKTTLNNELDISQMKQDAEELKASISNVKSLAHMEMDDISAFEDEEKKIKAKSNAKEKVTKKEDKPEISKEKKSKKEKIQMTNSETV
ncbi:MAG: Sec-independent protein translocase protein TatB [Campylobacterota bacterium]|nr:Sec-independent protein translocase protein TatB [Campylobacterota bacterium]